MLPMISKMESKQETMISQMAREVVSETNINTYDRALREKNIVIFGYKGDNDGEFVEELFNYLDIGLKKEDVKFNTFGTKKTIKMVFKEVGQKKKFLSLLYKLKFGPQKESLTNISVQHDLSHAERDHFKSLRDKAKTQNELEKSDEFYYTVRGPPFAFQIVKVNKAKNYAA